MAGAWAALLGDSPGGGDVLDDQWFDAAVARYREAFAQHGPMPKLPSSERSLVASKSSPGTGTLWEQGTGNGEGHGRSAHDEYKEYARKAAGEQPSDVARRRRAIPKDEQEAEARASLQAFLQLNGMQ